MTYVGQLDPGPLPRHEIRPHADYATHLAALRQRGESALSASGSAARRITATLTTNQREIIVDGEKLRVDDSVGILPGECDLVLDGQSRQFAGVIYRDDVSAVAAYRERLLDAQGTDASRVHVYSWQVARYGQADLPALPRGCVLVVGGVLAFAAILGSAVAGMSFPLVLVALCVYVGAFAWLLTREERFPDVRTYVGRCQRVGGELVVSTTAGPFRPGFGIERLLLIGLPYRVYVAPRRIYGRRPHFTNVAVDLAEADETQTENGYR